MWQVTPDFYRSALWLRTVRLAHCPECVGSVVGDHPRDWTERHTDAAVWLSPARLQALNVPYVGCNFNSPAGMALPRRLWAQLTAHAEAFCDELGLA